MKIQDIRNENDIEQYTSERPYAKYLFMSGKKNEIKFITGFKNDLIEIIDYFSFGSPYEIFSIDPDTNERTTILPADIPLDAVGSLKQIAVQLVEKFNSNNVSKTIH